MSQNPKNPQEPDTLEAMLARLHPLQEALKAQQLDPNDKRTGRKLLDELYDEDGLPK